MDAVVALRSFVEAFSEEEVAAIKPLIPQLLDEFFKLMNEVLCPSHSTFLQHLYIFCFYGE